MAGNTRFLFGFLLFAALASAASQSTTADFGVPSDLPDYLGFRTDLEFTTTFECSVVEGTGGVLSGVPCETPAVVCPGTQIEVTPTAYARWGDHTFDVDNSFPMTGEEPIPYGGSVSAHRATWLEPGLFIEYRDNYIDDYYDSTYSRYTDDLQTFYNEPITFWYLSEETFEYEPRDDTEAGVNVFCMAYLDTIQQLGSLDGVVESQALEGSSPSLASTTLSFDIVGVEQRVATELSYGDCFGAVVKHPLDGGTPDFAMYYYGYGRPTVPAARASGSSITVRNPTCSLNGLGVDVLSSSGLATLVDLWVTNGGESTAVATGASTSHPDFSVITGEEFCEAYGIFDCESGFGDPIAPGDPATLSVVIVPEEGATGFPEVCVDFECTSGSCGSGGTGRECFDLSGAMSCELEPPSQDMAQGQLYEFTTTCFDISGAEVECPDDDYSWHFDGIAGGFEMATSEHAFASTDSPVSAEGELVFECGDACTPCSSAITVTEPDLVCEVEPESADLEIGDSEDFEVTCYYEGELIPEDDPGLVVDWSMDDGLDGDLDDNGAEGATFTATEDSEGDLVATVTYNGITVMPSADIAVGAFIGPEVPPDDGGDDDSSTEWCQLLPGSAEGPAGSLAFFRVLCGPEDGRRECLPGEVGWSLWPPSIGDLLDSHDWDEVYEVVELTGEVGDEGRLEATIGGDPDHYCRAELEITEPTCVEYS